MVTWIGWKHSISNVEQEILKLEFSCVCVKSRTSLFTMALVDVDPKHAKILRKHGAIAYGCSNSKTKWQIFWKRKKMMICLTQYHRHLIQFISFHYLTVVCFIRVEEPNTIIIFNGHIPRIQIVLFFLFPLRKKEIKKGRKKEEEFALSPNSNEHYEFHLISDGWWLMEGHFVI